MSAPQVIANYEALFALTRQMHEAATQGQWEPLISIEGERNALLRGMPPDFTNGVPYPGLSGRPVRFIAEPALQRAEHHYWLPRSKGDSPIFADTKIATVPLPSCR